MEKKIFGMIILALGAFVPSALSGFCFANLATSPEKGLAAIMTILFAVSGLSFSVVAAVLATRK